MVANTFNSTINNSKHGIRTGREINSMMKCTLSRYRMDTIAVGRGYNELSKRYRKVSCYLLRCNLMLASHQDY
ncbi:hypothetical protein ACS126_03300 [Sphingobacterium lactis]|uniref:hypothetical protein n=1 Tax=Sphingobacterium lactis TaxID=797291 RepID=UPI003EC9330E